MRKWLLIGAMAVGLMAPQAYAQSVTQNNLSGNECWNVGQGPGGPGSYICSNLVRNSEAQITTTITGSLTIGTGATASLVDGGNLLVTAQPAAATITLPPNPFTDGGIVRICNVSASPWATNVVTVVANTGQTLSIAAPLTTMAASTCATFQFSRPTTNWYRIR